MQKTEALLQQIQALPPNRIAEIENFVAFIATGEQQRSLTRAAAASVPDFAEIWDNPEDDAYHDLMTPATACWCRFHVPTSRLGTEPAAAGLLWTIQPYGG